MNTLENRLLVEEEIKTYEEVLSELYKEQKKIERECKHEIKIENLEQVEYYPYFLEQRCYCLLCGKELTKRLFVGERIGKTCTISMTEYPCLNEKWGKKYRSEVEQIYLRIRRPVNNSEREIFFKLKEKLEELEDEANTD